MKLKENLLGSYEIEHKKSGITISSPCSEFIVNPNKINDCNFFAYNFIYTDNNGYYFSLRSIL